MGLTAVRREERPNGFHFMMSSALSPIANPLADRKLKKRVLKLTKKASADKNVRRGVKEVCKAIRKNERGICVFAGDITPIDVITHLPILCEEYPCVRPSYRSWAMLTSAHFCSHALNGHREVFEPWASCGMKSHAMLPLRYMEFK